MAQVPGFKIQEETNSEGLARKSVAYGLVMCIDNKVIVFRRAICKSSKFQES